MPTRLSFAIPYFTGVGYLELALRSLSAQTYTEWDAVVVDDAGPEPADELVRAIGDPRIRYVRNADNLGLARNWNKAISLTTGRLVTVLHCDDELEPDYAAVMIELMERYPDAIAGHCRATIIDRTGARRRTMRDSVKTVLRGRSAGPLVTSGDAGLQSLMRGNWIICPTLCFRRERLPDGPFDERWRFVQDLDLLARLLLDGGTLVGTPRRCYRYRRHGGNQTDVLSRDFVRYEEERALHTEVANTAGRLGWARTARTAHRALVLRLHLVVVAIGALARGRGHRAVGALRHAARG